MTEHAPRAAAEESLSTRDLVLGGLMWVALIAAVAWWFFGSHAEPEEKYYQGVVLRGDVSYASVRRWKPLGLQWLSSGPDGVAFAAASPMQAVEGQNVLVLVHGFGAPQSQLAVYFEGLISYLREDARIPASIIVYDWPSVEIDVDSAQSRSESRAAASRILAMIPGHQQGNRHTAWLGARYGLDQGYASTPGADGLADLLRALEGGKPASVSILAHSMGSYVVAETIKRFPDAFSGVKRVVLMAPDVPSVLFEDAAFRAASARIEQLHVLFSRHDRVLSLLSLAVNWKGRLGSDGPANATALPPNVTLRDVSETFGRRLDVHARYVTREGAAQLDLAALLGFGAKRE